MFFLVNSSEFIARVHLKCCIKRCMTSAMRWHHFSYSETSQNYDGRHGNFHFSQVNTTHIENMAAVTLLRRRASFWWREILAGGCADWPVVTNGIRKTYLYVIGSQRLLDIRRTSVCGSEKVKYCFITSLFITLCKLTLQYHHTMCLFLLNWTV